MVHRRAVIVELMLETLKLFTRLFCQYAYEHLWSCEICSMLLNNNIVMNSV